MQPSEAAEILRRMKAFAGHGIDKSPLTDAMEAGAEALDLMQGQCAKKKPPKCLFCDFTGTKDELIAHSAACEKHPLWKELHGRMFPIQQGSPVPWVEAERAYRTYAKLYSSSQTLERLSQRGGFGVKEFSCLWHGHDVRSDCPCEYPNFRSTQLESALAASRAEVAKLGGELEGAKVLLDAIRQIQPAHGEYCGSDCPGCQITAALAQEPPCQG